MKKPGFLRIALLAVLAALIVACASEPEIVEVTVETVREVEVPVEVEVVKEVEVEVVKEVEIEGETVEVVVTEIVEVVVEPTDVPDPQGGTMVESTFADASNLNPILASDSASFDIINKMFLGLVTTDAFTGETIGEIATGWDVSEDGLTYTFALRDDIT